LYRRHRLPVWSVLVLLTRGADSPPQTGLPLCDEAVPQLESVMVQVERRFEAEASSPELDLLRTATYILMGLRYDREVAARVIRGGRNMKESVTYQAILDEGRNEGRAEGRAEGRTEGRAEGRAEGAVQEARKLLLRMGRKRLGKPDKKVLPALEQMDVDQLERLGDRLLDVSSWRELLNLPEPRRRNGTGRD
jgi:hypothetical protein